MFKKAIQFSVIALLVGVFGFAYKAQAFPDLRGRILLQVEDKGQAWYVSPDDNQRYCMGRPDDAFNLMRDFGLGATNKDIDSFISSKAPSRLAGKILLRVEDAGQAYYVDAVSLKLYYLGRPTDAFNVIRERGLGISNTDLQQISIASGIAETKRFDFKYQNNSYYLVKEFSSDLYEEYSNAAKVYSYPSGQPPENIRDSFYGMLIKQRSGDDTIKEIIERFREIVANKNWTDDQFAEFIMAFVQYIPYDQTKLEAGNTNPYYPYETLYLDRGVCSDKTFLALTFLRELGYGAAILDFPEINHTAVGIQCPVEESINDSGYCYVETTNYFPLGIIPQNINGQAETNLDDFDKLFNPDVLNRIEIYQNTQGKVYQGIIETKNTVAALKAAQTKYLGQLTEINTLETALDAKDTELVAIKDQLDTYLSNNQTDEYNALVPTYNTKANEYNTDLATYGAKIDAYNTAIAIFNQDLNNFYQQ